MRINMENKSGSTVDAAYGDLLTSLYDQLAVKFGMLHQLSESAKLAAVARWLREKDSNLALPQAGPDGLESACRDSGSPVRTMVTKAAEARCASRCNGSYGRRLTGNFPLSDLHAPSTYVPPGTSVDSSVVDLRPFTSASAPL